MADLCWTGGLTEGRKIAAMADTYHKPFAPHDCVGPVGFIAGIHASFSQPNTLIQESVRAFYTGWYKELVTVDAHHRERLRVLPMEGPGLGTELLPAVFERPDLHRPPVGGVGDDRGCSTCPAARPSSPAPPRAWGGRWRKGWPRPARPSC